MANLFAIYRHILASMKPFRIKLFSIPRKYFFSGKEAPDLSLSYLFPSCIPSGSILLSVFARIPYYSPKFRIYCINEVVTSSQDNFQQVFSGSSAFPLLFFCNGDLLPSKPEQSKNHKNSQGAQKHHYHPCQNQFLFLCPGRTVLKGHLSRSF